MGNNPSTSKPSSAPGSGHESPRLPKREVKNPIAVTNQGVAVPPAPSLAQAQGANHGWSPHPRPAAPSQSSLPSSPPNSTAVSSKVAETRKTEIRPEPSKPVDVPTAQTEVSAARPHYSEYIDAQSSIPDMSYLTRPPRLPLPIEEEIHTPGSPIIAPADIGEPLEDVEDSEGLPQGLSTLSAVDLSDEEDAGEPLHVDDDLPTVPTRIEWQRGGKKVFVTGTIFLWNKKTKLHPLEGRPGVFAAVVDIRPGTHHVRFLVDGNMCTSPDLPTTVDFGNNLVNYIEVNADDIPAEPLDSGAPVSSPDHNSQQLTEPPTTDKAEAEQTAKHAKSRPVAGLDRYSNEIPQYLTEFDQPEDSPSYQFAVAAIEKLPQPPSLPGFLGKPLLNSAVLIKDDNSVLNMPNHTVLNHLATSSIKNNILALSATTRYRSKYVTTIIYKPATDGA